LVIKFFYIRLIILIFKKINIISQVKEKSLDIKKVKNTIKYNIYFLK